MCRGGDISIWGVRGPNEVAPAHRGRNLLSGRADQRQGEQQAPSTGGMLAGEGGLGRPGNLSVLLVASVLTRSREIPRLTPPSPGLA